MADYFIRRELNCTKVERRTEAFGFASQHWVLWPRLVVEMKFADGVRVEHQEERTLINDPKKGLGLQMLKVGKTYVINGTGGE